MKTFRTLSGTAGHREGVPVLPVYDMGSEATEMMAETAAIYGCTKVLIGTSRRGALYHIIKGHFQTRLEAILPPDIEVGWSSAPRKPVRPTLRSSE